jgi:hypothetical protein
MGGCRLPRVLLLAVVAALAAAAPGSAGRAPLVVPGVTGQAYAFAKGALADAGFAWRVDGPVGGYPANVVVAQTPAAGSRVVANGAPTIVLRLSRARAYAEQGRPQNASPYPGVPARLVGRPPAAKPERAVVVRSKGVPRHRPLPDGELPLPQRARELAAWLERRPEPTRTNVSHWLYQHNWVVAGARLRWRGGAEALRVLIRVDRRAQQLWGLGAKSERLARAALAEVTGT